MAAYYNEKNKFCAQWLRNLIAAGHIAPGEVDERSIEDVRPDDLKGFTQVHMFAGIGVWSYALRLAGWGDSRPVWTGSCPCQPFSAAGEKLGFADERHLWPAWYHLIRERKPGVLLGEQVASPDALDWLDLVHADMEEAGYACGPVDLCAAGAGAPHLRQRLFFVADTNGDRADRGHSAVQMGWVRLQGEASESHYRRGTQWANESRPSTLADVAAARVGRVRAYGNAIVAEAAKEFIAAYLETGISPASMKAK